MITRYNNLSLLLGLPGIILQVVGLVLEQNPGKEVLGTVVVVFGTLLLLGGLAFYALAKGRSPVWCLMAFFGLIGLIVLGCLADLEPERKRKKKRRRRQESDDDDEDAPPRKGRIRYDDDDDAENDERPRRRRRGGDDEDAPEAESGTRRARRDDESFEDEEAEQNEAKRPTPVGAATRLIECSACQKRLKIPATLSGKKVKCPACGTLFVAG